MNCFLPCHRVGTKCLFWGKCLGFSIPKHNINPLSFNLSSKFPNNLFRYSNCTLSNSSMKLPEHFISNLQFSAYLFAKPNSFFVNLTGYSKVARNITQKIRGGKELEISYTVIQIRIHLAVGFSNSATSASACKHKQVSHNCLYWNLPHHIKKVNQYRTSVWIYTQPVHTHIAFCSILIGVLVSYEVPEKEF